MRLSVARRHSWLQRWPAAVKVVLASVRAVSITAAEARQWQSPQRESFAARIASALGPYVDAGLHPAELGESLELELTKLLTRTVEVATRSGNLFGTALRETAAL